MTSSPNAGDASDAPVRSPGRGTLALLAGLLYLPVSFPCCCHSRVLPGGCRTSSGGGHEEGQGGAAQASPEPGTPLSPQLFWPVLKMEPRELGERALPRALPPTGSAWGDPRGSGEERMFPPPGHLFPAAFLVPHEEFVSKGQCRPEDAEKCILLTLLQGYFTHSWFGYTLVFLYSELCKLNLWFVIPPACGASQMFGCSLCKPYFSPGITAVIDEETP